MSERSISIIGLGYVGLPIAVAFGKKLQVIGFDIDKTRLASLKAGLDPNHEIDATDLTGSHITFTNQIPDLKNADFHIVTVPTPIDNAKRPDLSHLLNASETVGKILKKGDVVVYESTVYPGVTEDVCLPILEKTSGLKAGPDFKIGYSPERINPGDREHAFGSVLKIVSGMDRQALKIIATTYESVVHAGIFRAASIKTAEAAKVIENTQRDLNIALMNELAIIFDKMGLDTQEVIKTAATKWNFVKYSPGLVGGHCIGVDPYYLTHKAEQLGYHPHVILAGRRINDNMGKFIANKTIKLLLRSGHILPDSTVTVMGLTFKENCADIRNTKSMDVINELRDFGVDVQIHDPLANPDMARAEYGVELTKFENLKPSAALVLAVAHEFYKKLAPADFNKISKKDPVLIDVKGALDPTLFKQAGFLYWRL